MRSSITLSNRWWWDQTVEFRHIIAHKGPLKPSEPSYKGSKFNVMIEWEFWEVTSEPLSIIATDDPVTCAIYARESNLLDLDGWKHFKGIARWDKKLLCMVNQAKLQSAYTALCYKYGYEVLWDYNHAVELENTMATSSGKTLLPFKWPNSMSIRP